MTERPNALADALRALPLLPPSLLLWIMAKTGRSHQALRLMGRTLNIPGVKARAFAGYTPTARDVIVATTSKSGTNWAMQIALQLAWHGEAEFGYVHDLIPWPDTTMPSVRARLADPPERHPSPTGLRVIKTHYERPFVPIAPEAAYIVVLRDPKDVAVSGYHFARSIFGSVLTLDHTPEAWVDEFLGGRYVFGSWAEHSASWWAVRDEPNVLILHFAEMKRDLEGTVRRVADLMGLTPTDEVLARVVERSGFAWMKAQDRNFVPPSTLPLFGNPRERATMMRRGASGGSAKLLTPELARRIDEGCRAELERLGSDLPYDALYGPTSESE